MDGFRQHQFDDDENAYEVHGDEVVDDDHPDDSNNNNLNESGSDFDDSEDDNEDLQVQGIDNEIEFGDEYGDEFGDANDDDDDLDESEQYGDEYGDENETETDDHSDDFSDDSSRSSSDGDDDDEYGDEFGDCEEYGDEYGDEYGEEEETTIDLDKIARVGPIPPSSAFAPQGGTTTNSDATDTTIDARSQTTTPTKESSSHQSVVVTPTSSQIDTSNLTLAEMIALRSSPDKRSNSIHQTPKQPQTPTSILDLLSSSRRDESKDNSVDQQQQQKEDSSSSMSLAQMIAARSKNNDATAAVAANQYADAESPSRRQISDPIGQKASIVYKNRENMIKRRRQQQQKKKQKARRKPPTSNNNNNNRRSRPAMSSQKPPGSAAAPTTARQQPTAAKQPTTPTNRQHTTPTSNSGPPPSMFKSIPPVSGPPTPRQVQHKVSAPPTPRQQDTKKSIPAATTTSQTSIPCTTHLRYGTIKKQRHASWKRFETKRRMEMRIRRQSIKEEWAGACLNLQHGIQSTKMAERIIQGFVHASKKLATDFRAISEDSVFNDSGKVVQNNSFSQRRLVQKRNSSSSDISDILGSSSPILAACLECYGILAEQAEILQETSSQISWEYLPKLRGVLANLEGAVSESELNVKRILEEFDRYETNMAYTWDTFESLLLSNPVQHKKKVEASKSDIWFVQQSYFYAVLLQQNYLRDLRSKMDGICNQVVTLERYRLREVREILMDGFYKKQIELFQQLPLFENEMLKSLKDARIDEDSLEEILHDRSKTRLKYSQSHRSSILNRSSLNLSGHLESESVPSIEGEFGNPLESSAVLLATVVELQRSGSSFSSFVSVSWKRTLAVVLETELVCFLELPKSQQENIGKQSVEDAFLSLRSNVQFDANTRRKRLDFAGKLNPFVSWRVSKCSVDISNIQDRIVEVTEVGRRLSSPNLFLLGKSVGGDGISNENDNDNGNATQVETKYSLRFYSAADALKWLGAFEKTKGKLHELASDESNSAASSSVGTSEQGTFDGDDDSNGTQDGSASSKSIVATDEKENGEIPENGSIPSEDEDGKLANVSLAEC